MSHVRFDNVSKYFGELAALKRCSLEIRGGELLGLLGPSGCGKTTMLRLLAGFLRPSEGEIYVDDAPLGRIPPYRRNFGLVFQNYALFPHMTVFENVAFGLRMRRVSSTEVVRQVDAAIDLMRLGGLVSRYPAQLSGGQQQRVALARALVIRPTVLLLDEPLGALDRQLRERMQVELRTLVQRVGVTTVFVTHDQEEALALSDRIAVMRHGVVEQVGTPEVVYDAPRTKFVASFMGTSNFVEGEVVGVENEWVIVRASDGARLRAPVGEASVQAGASVAIAIRPERLRLCTAPPEANPNVLSATVSDVRYLGARTRVDLESPGCPLVAECSSSDVPGERGTRLFVSWDPLAGVVVQATDVG